MRWGVSTSAVLAAATFTTLASSQSTARFDDVPPQAAPVPPAPAPAAPSTPPPAPPPAAPSQRVPATETQVRTSVPVPEASSSAYVYREVVDPFPTKKERPEAQLVDPYAGYRAPIPQVDELLIVNPYSKMLSKTARSTRYFETTPGQVRTGMLEISAPPEFRGWVYLNGMALAGLPARTTVLAGDHGLTVAPAGGTPFTVWIQVGPGERQHFRFSLNGAGVLSVASPPVTH